MDRRTQRSAAGAAAVVVCVAAAVATGAASTAAEPERARNVIYMVGDGMGLTHIDAARLRYAGAAGTLALQTLPVTGTTRTYAVEEGSDLPEVVTDSSSSATAWASGVKTYNEAVGKDAFGEVVPTVMEEAEAAGLRTGNVTTAEVTDATPAAMYSHVDRRGCQGPSTASASEDCGGETPIAQQVSRNGTADVILGGGLQRFEPGDAAAFEEQGYQVLGSFGDPSLEPGAQNAYTQRVATRDDLATVESGKVVGLFNRGNLTVEQAKEDAPTSAGALEPSLAEMTAKAISLLDSDDGPGFLLQVEGALIDKRSHANDAAAVLREVKELDEAVEVALEFAEEDGETMVVVTADHECAGFAIIGQGSFTNAEAVAPPGNIDEDNQANTSALARSVEAHVKDPARSPGISNAPDAVSSNSFAPATFRTPDDPEGVEDGTEEASLWLTYLSGNHTGADVPVSASGPGSEAFRGLHDNTENYGFIKAALGLR